jgi:UDP-glucose:(heptosyl)LPS alpha-1,3-glucosyltransferase
VDRGGPASPLRGRSPLTSPIDPAVDSSTGSSADSSVGRRIGFLIDRWEAERGGAERALTRFASYLIERGHEVHAFALSASAGAPGRFHRVRGGWAKGLRRSSFERQLARRLVDAAEEAECEVTIGIRHLPRVDVYWPHGGSHLHAWRAHRRARGRDPVASPTGRHRVFLDFERKLIAEGGARRVICVSELVREELSELYPAGADRLVVVPNGVDLELFHPRHRAGAGRQLREELGIPDRVPLLLFVARDPRLKGLGPLLEALVGLRDRPWTLLICGPRHPRRWIGRAARAGLDPGRVLVREHLPAPALFAAADLTLHPTWRDTSSLVILESLAAGTPVVTTQLAGAAGQLRPRPGAGPVGTVVSDPTDIPRLREAIASWLEKLNGVAIDREAVRDAVAELGVIPWLEKLEEIVLSTCDR